MRTDKISLISILAVMGLIAVSCSQDNPNGSDNKPVTGKTIILPINARSAANNLVDFYLKFTIDMAENSKQGVDDLESNIVVSPLSAAMVLSMTANACEERVKKEYIRYLGVYDIENLNALSKILIEKLPEVDNTSSFNIGNSVWVNSNYNLKLSEKFSDIVTSKYLAITKNLDFTNVNATLKELNDWCGLITNDKITGHFKTINPTTYAILLNSIYFRGKWHDDIFDSSRTKAAIFHGLNGDTYPLTMESDVTEGLYSNDGIFESFTLSFGNNSYRLEIILPLDNEDADDNETKLTIERICSLRESYQTAHIKAFLPKFSVESNHNLNEMLERIGLKAMTISGLNMFSKPIEGAIQYNQSAAFSIDETGAEAAAVTSGSVDPTAPGPTEELLIKVDRPFYFFIREYSTNACIISGRICNL